MGAGLIIMAGRARRDRRTRRCRSSSAPRSSASVSMNSSLNIGCMGFPPEAGKGPGRAPATVLTAALLKSPRSRECVTAAGNRRRAAQGPCRCRCVLRGRAEHSGGGHAARSRPPGLAPGPCWPPGGCGSCSARASLATEPVHPPRRPDRPGAEDAAPPRISRLASSQISPAEEQNTYSALIDRGKMRCRQRACNRH